MPNPGGTYQEVCERKLLLKARRPNSRRRDEAGSLGTRKGKKLRNEDGDKVVSHNLNIIAGGFTRDRETNFPR